MISLSINLTFLRQQTSLCLDILTGENNEITMALGRF